jgi:hypothetical protein
MLGGDRRGMDHTLVRTFPDSFADITLKNVSTEYHDPLTTYLAFVASALSLTISISHLVRVKIPTISLWGGRLMRLPFPINARGSVSENMPKKLVLHPFYSINLGNPDRIPSSSIFLAFYTAATSSFSSTKESSMRKWGTPRS